jgi:drug/metabolite transporter (DMT)-like permease
MAASFPRGGTARRAPVPRARRLASHVPRGREAARGPSATNDLRRRCTSCTCAVGAPFGPRCGTIAGAVSRPAPEPSPIARGAALAVIAAALFGLTVPVVKRAGAGVGAFATAALLYAGAAIGSGLGRARGDEPPIRRAHLPRIAAVAALGAALAPASLAWGLARTGALSASLLLNLEAVLTVLLAWAVHREPVGRRVLAAVALMLAGGGLLALRGGSFGASTLLGLGAVALATFSWACDNVLTRPLADLDPRAVVLAKASIGAALSLLVALASREAWPRPLPAAALLACGATGYGLSLRLYLHAQRSLGAGRTGSIFALAPFLGALLAFLLGEREGAGWFAAAAALFAGGVYLHATEDHGHPHRHEATEHEHAHRHDDGHHTHVHDPEVAGAHSHVHRHEEVEHEHAHGVDLHHDHHG